MKWMQSPAVLGDRGKEYVSEGKALILARSGWSETTAPTGAPTSPPAESVVTYAQLAAAVAAVTATVPDATSTVKGKMVVPAGTADDPLYPATRILGQLADIQIPDVITRDYELAAVVQAKVDALIAGAPAARDTLKELSDALTADESAAATLAALVATKGQRLTRRPISSTMTTAVTAVPGDLIIGDATTAAIVVTIPVATDGARISVKRTASSTWPVVIVFADGSATITLVDPSETRTMDASGAVWDTTSGLNTISALNNRYPARGGYTVLVEDDFSRYPDNTALSGVAPRTGPAWVTSGPSPTAVVGGKAYSTSNGYLYPPTINTGAVIPTEMVVEGTFSGTDVTVNPITMAIGNVDGTGAFQQVIHPNMGPRGFTLQLKEKDQPSNEFVTLMSGRWDQPCIMDDTKRYRLHIIVRGATATVIGPHGEVFSATDPRILKLSAVANLTYFQPTTVNSGAGVFKATRALVIGLPTTQPLSLGEDILDRGGARGADPYRRLVGTPGGHGRVAIGESPNYGVPSVMFGAESEVVGAIRTVLTADAAAGATTISTWERIPIGSSIRLDGGAVAETVTASAAAPGGTTGAATRALTAGTTYAHAAGSVVIAIPPAGRFREMRYDPVSDYFYLPDSLVVTVPTYLAVGSQNDVYFRRIAAQVMGLGAGSSFQADGVWNGGTFRHGSYYTWFDGDGNQRSKGSAPTSATDGLPVGRVAQGTATLSGGTVTVSNAKITAASLIAVNILAPGGTVGSVYISARTAGTSFTITSTSASDTSTVFWQIVQY